MRHQERSAIVKQRFAALVLVESAERLSRLERLMAAR